MTGRWLGWSVARGGPQSHSLSPRPVCPPPQVSADITLQSHGRGDGHLASPRSQEPGVAGRWLHREEPEMVGAGYAGAQEHEGLRPT